MSKKLKPKTSRKELKSQQYIQTGTDGSKSTSHKWKMSFVELLQQEGFYERIIDYYTQHPSLLKYFPYMVVGDAKRIEELGDTHDDKLKKGRFYLGYRPEPSDTYGKPSEKGLYYIVYVNPTNDPDEIGIMMMSLPHLSDIVEYDIGRPITSLTAERISEKLRATHNNEGKKYSNWEQDHASGFNLLRNEGALIETNRDGVVKDGSYYKGNMDFYSIFDEEDYLGLFNWWW